MDFLPHIVFFVKTLSKLSEAHEALSLLQESSKLLAGVAGGTHAGCALLCSSSPKLCNCQPICLSIFECPLVFRCASVGPHSQPMSFIWCGEILFRLKRSLNHEFLGRSGGLAGLEELEQSVKEHSRRGHKHDNSQQRRQNRIGRVDSYWWGQIRQKEEVQQLAGFTSAQGWVSRGFFLVVKCFVSCFSWMLNRISFGVSM